MNILLEIKVLINKLRNRLDKPKADYLYDKYVQ